LQSETGDDSVFSLITYNIAGLPDIMREFPVRTFWDSGQNSNLRTYRSILGLCLKRNVRYLQPRRGLEAVWGGAQVDVLHPKKTRLPRPEDNSLVFRVRFAAQQALRFQHLDLAGELGFVAALMTCQALGAATGPRGQLQQQRHIRWPQWHWQRGQRFAQQLA
jgi:hypothetical protein